MSQLLKGPQRFTHPEWTYSNNMKYRSAEVERMQAERLMNESDRLIAETSRRTVRTQMDVDKKFDQRLSDVNYWKDELDRKLGDLDGESGKLETYITRLEKALEAVAEPLHISQHCLRNREGRVAIDLVHDDVQKELMKEAEVHQGVQGLLMRTLEQAKEQLRMNRKAMYRIKEDIKDKYKAKSLDEYCSNLKNNTQLTHLAPGAVDVDINSVTPEQWQACVNENIQCADRERQNSLNLRAIVDGVLQQTSNDQAAQRDAVDLAFRVRIAETKDTKGKLEEHLKRVLTEVSNMEDNIQNLKIAIDTKEQPLKLTETRLEIRRDRPNLEQCRDSVQYNLVNCCSAMPQVDDIKIRLIQEDTEIKTDMTSLARRLADSQASLKGLVRRQLDLEEDIQVKANTIFIDEVQCMGMRESISIKSF